MNLRVAAAALTLAVAGCAAPLAESPPPVAGATSTKAPEPGAELAVAGQRLYSNYCLSCHQAGGGGVPNMQPAIVGGTWVKGDPRALALFVMTGGFDSSQRKDSATENTMPAFAHLSNEALASILTYIRGRFGDGASAVTPQLVAEVRATLPK